MKDLAEMIFDFSNELATAGIDAPLEIVLTKDAFQRFLDERATDRRFKAENVKGHSFGVLNQDGHPVLVKWKETKE